MVDIKDRIKEALEARSMTASELAKQSGINKGAISKYVNRTPVCVSCQRQNARILGTFTGQMFSVFATYGLNFTENFTENRKSLPTQSREANSFPEVNMVRTE